MIQPGPGFRPPPGLGQGPTGELQVALLLVVLLACVMTLASFPGTYVFTSWYRDPARNAAVGDVPNSRHLLGLGLDVAVNPDRLRTLATLGLEAGAARTALLLNFRRLREMLGLGSRWQAVDEGDHVHFEIDF